MCELIESSGIRNLNVKKKKEVMQRLLMLEYWDKTFKKWGWFWWLLSAFLAVPQLPLLFPTQQPGPFPVFIGPERPYALRSIFPEPFMIP